MEKKYFLQLFFTSFALFTIGLQDVTAQVGIGTVVPSPKSALEILSSNSGVLFPRVNTAQRTAIAPTVGGDFGLKVYDTNTKSYWYWDGAIWVEQGVASNDWKLTGNGGTTPGTHFIGTTGTQDLRFKTNNTDRLNLSDATGQLQSYYTGTAAAPAYSWNGDSDTGIFQNGANILGFSTNSLERVRVDNNGFVGIGTTAPTNKLYVRHDEDNRGVVSIDNATGGGFAGVYFRQNTAYRGHIGYVNTGGSSSFGGKGAYQLMAGDRPMIFGTNLGSETYLERMRIEQNGNVGIGTTPATAKLHLAAGTTSPSSAPLKLTSGTNMTTPEDGAIEFDGTNYFATSAGTRYTLAKTLTNTANLDFPNTAGLSNSTLTITVTGAQDGDIVTFSTPNSVTATGIFYQAWVSAPNTVSIRLNNFSASPYNAPSANFRVAVLKY